MSAPDPLGAAPYCYLTTSGRRTGRPHRIEIWFALYEGVVYLLSGGHEEADWVRNVIASPHVTIEVAGQVRTSIARVVAPGTEEDVLARRLLVEKYQPGYGEDLSGWGSDALPVAIDWGVG